MSEAQENLAASVLATARAMNASGINRGSAGNVSARCKCGFVITPTGMAYDACTEADMVQVGLDGAVSAAAPRKPSSEWRFHRDIYAACPAAGAVVTRPVQDQFYGDRSGTFTDPFGHVWTIATHIKDLSPEEMQRAAEAAMKPQA